MLLNRKINNQEQVANEWSRLWVNFDILVLSYIFGGEKKGKIKWDCASARDLREWRMRTEWSQPRLLSLPYLLFYFFIFFVYLG